MRQSGKKGRKVVRAIKRKRYADAFIRRFGMTRVEWVAFKKECRKNGTGYLIAEKMQTAYSLAVTS